MKLGSDYWYSNHFGINKGTGFTKFLCILLDGARNILLDGARAIKLERNVNQSSQKAFCFQRFSVY